MERMQHAVADKPMRVRRVELRVRTVAVEGAVQFARQFAGHFEERRIAFERDRRDVAARRTACGWLLHGASFYQSQSLHRKDNHKRKRPGGSSKSLQCKNHVV